MKTHAEPKTTAPSRVQSAPVPNALAHKAQLRNALLRAGVQPRLEIGAVNDPLEREADAVAGRILRMTEPQAAQGNFTRERTSATPGAMASPHIESGLIALSYGGSPLDASSRAFFEPRFGHDFSNVRLHTDAPATRMADALNARAFTLGSSIAFAENTYSANTHMGRSLLGHELAHVVQQQSMNGTASQPTIIQCQNEKSEINYYKAERSNKEYAKKLKWDALLKEVNKEWSKLWNEEKYKEFADSVAFFQTKIGFRGKQIDGVLGPQTWDRCRPIHDVIADRPVFLNDSKRICTIATKERLQVGYKRATGQDLVSIDKKSMFNSILQSIPEKMKDKDIDDEYKGKGAAGALAYIGKGVLVSESQIWEDRILKPGAPLQVWKKTSDYEKVKKGEKIESYGTSFIFVEYVNQDKIKVRHYDKTETLNRPGFSGEQVS